MHSSTITNKGQTTIPNAIRKYLHLQSGDRLHFMINDAGKVIILPATVDVTELKGMLPPPKKPVSIERMNKTIKRRCVKKCSE